MASKASTSSDSSDSSKSSNTPNRTKLPHAAESSLDADGQRKNTSRLIDRESSWLAFNQRVLTLAQDVKAPLLERLKFCAIFSANLDEFFEVRVAGLKDQAAAGVSVDDPQEKLTRISQRVAELFQLEAHIVRTELSPLLSTHGIEIVGWADIDPVNQAAMTLAFEDGIFPVLTPLAVDPGHPFPYISNKSLNLGVVIADGPHRRRFARVKVPPLLPRFIPIGSGDKLLPLEAFIAAHADMLFPGLTIIGAHCFRVTRNGDLSVDDSDAEDLLAAVETELRRRRFGRAVRLEVAADAPEDMIALLQDELELGDQDVFKVDGLIDLTSLWSVHGLARPDLKDDQWPALCPADFLPVDDENDADMFAAIREQDILVHHPYESFGASVEAFVRQAAADPSVLTIKMTLYRTSGNSPIARSLIEAAERGKQVAVLIELKARFDEQANITWARAMEEAGVHVAYGVVGLKTHTKVILVVRAEEQGLRRYCHLGTGNYNSSTARLYEDIGLFTADPQIGTDLTRLFNTLTGFGRAQTFDRLIVAPERMRDRVLELIRGEFPTDTRGPGRIVMKLNSLVDPGIIEGLYQASQAGVTVDLVVRGMCCLRPGVAGMSENIHVRSVLGRYLEHSRVYYFAHGTSNDNAESPAWFIGSADMMQRNLNRRVETLVPITAAHLVPKMEAIIETLLRPDVRSFVLHSDGSWEHVGSVDAQRERFGQVVAEANGSRR
jgi:polyphosphate kinase